MKLSMRNRVLFFLLTAFILCILLVSCSVKPQNNEQSVQSLEIIEEAQLIDGMKLMTAMFPGETFTKQGKMYNAGERNNYYIESIIPGSFVNKEKDELLVVVRRPQSELAHAASFYNAYMTVFDNVSGKPVSGVKLFQSDEGTYKLYDSRVYPIYSL